MKKEKVLVPSEAQLPIGYSLLQGEVFIPLKSKAESLPESYFIGEEPPNEEEEGESFIVGESWWFDLKNNKVFSYSGKNTQNVDIWKEQDFTYTKYVVDFETNHLVGKIVCEGVSTSSDDSFLMPEVPPASLDDLMEEI